MEIIRALNTVLCLPPEPWALTCNLPFKSCNLKILYYMKRFIIHFLKHLHVVLLAAPVLFASCTKDFPEINTDQNSIAVVGPSEIPFLFSRAQSTAINSQ